MVDCGFTMFEFGLATFCIAQLLQGLRRRVLKKLFRDPTVVVLHFARAPKQLGAQRRHARQAARLAAFDRLDFVHVIEVQDRNDGRAAVAGGRACHHEGGRLAGQALATQYDDAVYGLALPVVGRRLIGVAVTDRKSTRLNSSHRT